MIFAERFINTSFAHVYEIREVKNKVLWEIIGGIGMRTSKEYLAKLAQMRPNIYMDGELMGRDHPDVVHASNGIQRTFDLVNDPEYKDLLTATSHISGKTINRFTHIHQSPEDLLLKQRMTRRMCK